MEMTTIAIPKDLKKKIDEFGLKGESYADILSRLYKSARDRQLNDLLFDCGGCITVKDALERAKVKWQ